MKLPILALYAGPDQVMVATSALAAILGFILMLWNKLIALFGRIWNRFRPAGSADAQMPDRRPTSS
ncbi:MAG TPA: hypothetical protein VFB00_11345 [Terriglobales bacterium]|nr:hypothetical protein [Terriglobales bacterium]